MLSLFRRNRFEEFERTGSDIAGLLFGSWRESPLSPGLSESKLNSIAQRLCESGAAALAWWRIRNSPLVHTRSGERLRNAYRQFRLSAVRHEREIKRVLLPLYDAGIETVLVKGWAAARLYPDRGLRPYGDVDLCVAHDQFSEAARVLKGLEGGEGHHVDLHVQFDGIGCGTRVSEARAYARARSKSAASVVKRAFAHGRAPDTWNEMFARSQPVDLEQIKVRVLCPEDHLRILSQHFLRSGALRPHGLIDIALILERHAGEFDWELCLGSNSLYANWILCTVGLAQLLLGAKGPEVNVQSTERPLKVERTKNCAPRLPLTALPLTIPTWLAPAVLRQWGRPREHFAAQIAPGPSMKKGFAQIVSNLYLRWENPVRATARVNRPFDNRPAWISQAAESLQRLPELVK